MTYRLTILVTMLFVMATGLSAQVKEPNSEITKPATTAKDTLATDTILPLPDIQAMESTYNDISIATGAAEKDSVIANNKKGKTEGIKIRKPDPSTATWLALVFPGAGQMYNRKFWKLPIVYGGFVGCLYAYNWNVQMYKDYRQAYLDIMDDDPGTASYEDFLPPRYNIEANKDYLTRIFKNRKDNYRRQRDLSIVCFIGVYILSVVDAYVDAELSNFDITNDLSVQVSPTTIETDNKQALRRQAYGLQCSFSF